MFIVYAGSSIDSDDAVTSTHRMCAERRFIERERVRALKRGVHPTRVDQYLKRKIGHIAIWRLTKAGDLATSCPCELCREQLIEIGLLVSFVDHAGNLVERVPASSCPAGILTSAQRNRLHIG